MKNFLFSLSKVTKIIQPFIHMPKCLYSYCPIFEYSMIAVARAYRRFFNQLSVLDMEKPIHYHQPQKALTMMLQKKNRRKKMSDGLDFIRSISKKKKQQTASCMKSISVKWLIKPHLVNWLSHMMVMMISGTYTQPICWKMLNEEKSMSCSIFNVS